MRTRPLAFAPALLLVALAACSRTVNTLPPLVSPTAAAEEHTLHIPPGLEVRSVDYQASLYSNVSGTGGEFGITDTRIGGRAFVKVYAVDTATGEQVLLVYENIALRREPIQVIRFRPGPTSIASQ